jgi:hypothetical protein
VEEPEDWEREYADTLVSVIPSQVEPQPFRLRYYRTGRWVGVLPMEQTCWVVERV